MEFKEIQRNTVFTGKAFNVELVTMLLPNGRETRYDLVNHPGAVTIIPIDEAGRILFVRQFRPGARRELLELPAGVLNSGEDPVGCAGREIREETGMAAGNLRLLGKFFLAPGYSSEYMHVFLATKLAAAPLKADEDEFLRVEAISVAEALHMAENGEIEDGKSLASLLLARPYIDQIRTNGPASMTGC